MRIEFEESAAKRPGYENIECHPVIVFDNPDTDGILYGYRLNVMTIKMARDGRSTLVISKRGKFSFLTRDLLFKADALHSNILRAWELYKAEAIAAASGEEPQPVPSRSAQRLSGKIRGPYSTDEYLHLPPRPVALVPIAHDDSGEQESPAARPSGTQRAGDDE